MKKVINGRVYNTDTAGEIASWDNGKYPNDHSHCEETLYVTPKGAYFVAGSGGGLTSYAESCGSASFAGSDMNALSKAEALAWCEEREISADVIAEYFDIEEG